MIVDSHCHAWPRWPYEPPVPDSESRGKVEQLLFEMDRHGVDEAVLVCARIDHNPDNNEYGAANVRRFPERLHMFADVDCSWWPTYHASGAADRLREAAARYPMKGFTHYVKGDDDGTWFESGEGEAFFEAARELGLIASIAAGARFQPVFRRVAARFPEVPFLFHHMAGNREGDVDTLKVVTASASTPNIHIKLSGFAYVAKAKWDFPFTPTHDIVKGLYEHFGPDRLCWGSDYPVVRQYMTFQHALEAFRTHCDFIPEPDRAKILGPNLKRLLDAARSVS